MLAGVIVGILLRFGLPDSTIAEFIFARKFIANNTCGEGDLLEIGEIIQVSSYNAETGDGDIFLCSVTGKVFRDQEGNYIRHTVSSKGALLISFSVLHNIIVLIKGGILISRGGFVYSSYAAQLERCVVSLGVFVSVCGWHSCISTLTFLDDLCSQTVCMATRVHCSIIYLLHPIVHLSLSAVAL